ncbi:MAG: hypothetical protein L0Y38_03290 [Methylococcaceae bacterium]|nr:hypothetical protein [Methylococcaceae bacterium]MCI0668511.1 hypothetical protein [Methylococcaceae bacterium]MCI0732833.1 hypothetical protein [Methylococcaceae bacterium]
MQCFERHAMYLKLYRDAVVEIPRLEFDREMLDQVLSDCGIDHLSTLIALDDRQRGDIVVRIKLLTDVESPCAGDHAAGRDRPESEEFSSHALPLGLLTSNPRHTQAVLY